MHNPANQLYTESRTNDAYAWTASVAVNRSYAVNGQNQYTGTTSNGSASATFTHDANGNLTSDGTTTFSYDAENRLVSASGAKNATLVYDPLGRLFQVHSPATGVTQFVYDGDELVPEYDGAGTLLRRYVHGDSEDDPLFWYEGAGFDQPRFPYSNHQGSVTAVAGPGAAALWIKTYDEYGIPGANNQGRFQYTGQAWIPELGMYHYKARIYSPTLGRFLQVDPIGYQDQINLYAYVGNDPLNRIAPTGLADVNFMNEHDDSVLQAAGREMDMTNMVTVIAHGPPAHERTEESYKPISDERLAAGINAASRSQAIFLGICSMAGTPEGLAQIDRLSALTGNRPMIAATTLIGWTHNKSGSKMTALHGGSFKVFNGSFANLGVNVPSGFKVTEIQVNRKGEWSAVMSGAETGSRIRTERTEKLKMEK